MYSEVSYNLAERKLIINNPYCFLMELKYWDIENILVNLKRAIDFNDLAQLYEMVMQTAADNSLNWDGLITNERNIKANNYLNSLDSCLRTLTRGQYIDCKYRTKFNERKDVTAIKIVDLKLLKKGKKTLLDIDQLKGIDIDHLLKRCLSAYKEYALTTNVLELDKESITHDFEEMTRSVSSIHIFQFNNYIKRDMEFNYYKGQFEVNDINKLIEFINRYNNFQLESFLKDFFHRSTIEIYDLKVILNALVTDQMESVYKFMEQDDLLRHIAYLVNKEYVRMDYSYSSTDQHPFITTVKIHAYVVTESGHAYLENDCLTKMKNSSPIIQEIRSALQTGVKEKDGKSYFHGNAYIKNFIRFKSHSDK